MFIEVIPFGGSIDNKGLTYYVRDELAINIRIGCFVEVPFRNVVDYAIVTSLENLEIPENPKSIIRVVTSVPLLASYQIRSIFEISSYYFVHAHHILSLFLSKSLVRYLEKKDFSLLSPQVKNEKKITRDDSVGFYHHTSNESFFQEIQKQAIDRTVIVFPDDFSLEAYLRIYPINSETTLCIPDKLTETKKYKAFCSIYNGEKNIIIGTRRILYYNLSHYDRILYIEDSLHKSAMRFGHTYKHLEILRKIFQNSNFNIMIYSTIPSIESMYLLHSGIYKKLNG
ncbi:hypothetical protein AUJ87_00365 [Candidatus Gracilibacteria bacterium CG1_02_38_174]|nr:MAG: hypothetical protein AUJ87_00365 [Candidatus Gracilibacteria bacterium CG1_02_38_174]